MSFLRQCASVLIAPLQMATLLALAGTAARRGAHRALAAALFTAAAVLAYAASTAAVGDALLGPLEREYAPLAAAAPPTAGWIVVLGSDYEPRGSIPLTAALDADGLARIVEGVVLIRRNPSMRLLVSGGAPAGQAAPALGYAMLARELGVPDSAMSVSDRPLDTNGEAHAIVRALGGQPFLLVTSAYHMPRAMRLMQRVGARPIAAPTLQLVKVVDGWTWRRFLPTSSGLAKTERALHEYLGLLALRLGLLP